MVNYILVKHSIPLLVDNKSEFNIAKSSCDLISFIENNKYYVIIFIIVLIFIIRHYKYKKRQLNKLRSLGNK